MCEVNLFRNVWANRKIAKEYHNDNKFRMCRSNDNIEHTRDTFDIVPKGVDKKLISRIKDRCKLGV